MGSRCENRRVIIGILPCVVSTSLETCASMATIACVDMLMVRRNPAKRRKVRVLKEQLRFWKKERSKVVYLKIQIQRSLFCGKLDKRDSTLRRDTPEILRMHLVQNWIRERKGVKKVKLMNVISARRSLRKEHLRKPHDKKSTPAKQHGIWREKYVSTRSRTKLRFVFCVKNKGTGASLQKHRRTHVFGWFGSFNAHAEQEGFKLRCNGYFTEVQKTFDGSDRKWRSANIRGGTSVCSRSLSVRHSASTRRNASSSIAC